MKYAKPHLYKTQEDTIRQYCGDGSTTNATQGCVTGGTPDADGKCHVGSNPGWVCIDGTNTTGCSTGNYQADNHWCMEGGSASNGSAGRCATGGVPAVG